MTFEQQFALFIGVCLAIGALIVYAVHLATRGETFAAIRSDLADRGHTATVTKLRHGARHRGRAVTSMGGAGRPSAGTTSPPRHARAA